VAFTLLKDGDSKSLRQSLTRVGGKHWQSDTRIKDWLFTRALGEWPAATLGVARKEAQGLRYSAEQGIDSGQGEAFEKSAKAQAKTAIERAAKFTFGALMADYANELERQGKTSHAKLRGMVRLHLIDGAPRLANAATAGVEWVPTIEPVGQFQAKRIRSGVETALASPRVSQEIRGHLLSHGVTGVQTGRYDGHEYAPQKLEALETLHRNQRQRGAYFIKSRCMGVRYRILL
jgi:hypothetical protein